MKSECEKRSIGFLNMSQSLCFLFYFRPFLISTSIIQIEKSADGVLGIWTQCRKMVGADKTRSYGLNQTEIA